MASEVIEKTLQAQMPLLSKRAEAAMGTDDYGDYLNPMLEISQKFPRNETVCSALEEQMQLLFKRSASVAVRPLHEKYLKYMIQIGKHIPTSEAIKRTLEEQLQLLSERSVGDVSAEEYADYLFCIKELLCLLFSIEAD